MLLLIALVFMPLTLVENYHYMLIVLPQMMAVQKAKALLLSITSVVHHWQRWVSQVINMRPLLTFLAQIIQHQDGAPQIHNQNLLVAYSNKLMQLIKACWLKLNVITAP